MNTYPIHCYSLNRPTPFQDMDEYRLPCSLDDALKFLALFLGVKSLLLPAEINQAYAIPLLPFFVRQVSTAEVVNNSFDSLFPLLEENRWFHFVRRLLARLPVTAHLMRREKAVPETIFELFATANKVLLSGPLPEGADDGLLVARIHFWPARDTVTYVQIFYGWHDDFALDEVQQLCRVIDGYLNRVIYLFGPNMPLPAVDTQPGHVTAVKQTPADASPAEPTNYQSSKPSSPFPVREKPVYMSTTREEAVQIIDPPRLYAYTLTKICHMVSWRQQLIEAGEPIQDIETVRSKMGPSINSLRKLPELVANWKDPRYCWYADVWLRQQSGHAPHERTRLLNELREKLMADDWTVVISRADGKGNGVSVPKTVNPLTTSLRPETNTAVS